jgi:hypothetical protein
MILPVFSWQNLFESAALGKLSDARKTAVSGSGSMTTGMRKYLQSSPARPQVPLRRPHDINPRALAWAIFRMGLW